MSRGRSRHTLDKPGHSTTGRSRPRSRRPRRSSAARRSSRPSRTWPTGWTTSPARSAPRCRWPGPTSPSTRSSSTPPASTRRWGSTTPTPSTTTRTSARPDVRRARPAGRTVDLSFQVLGGDYTPSSTPDGSTAFDDRDLRDRRRRLLRAELRPGGLPRPCAHHVALPETAAMLAVREVYDDWAAERGTHHDPPRRHPRRPVGRPGPTPEAADKRYAVAAKMLIGADPDVVRVPGVVLPERAGQHADRAAADAGRPGVAVLLGRPLRPRRRRGDGARGARAAPRRTSASSSAPSGTPRSTTSSTRPRSTATRRRSTPTAVIRLVVAEQDPGVANWVERIGHDRGYLQFRWQRLDGPLTAEDGPTLTKVRADEVPGRPALLRATTGSRPSSGPSGSPRGSVASPEG